MRGDVALRGAHRQAVALVHLREHAPRHAVGERERHPREALRQVLVVPHPQRRRACFAEGGDRPRLQQEEVAGPVRAGSQRPLHVLLGAQGPREPPRVLRDGARLGVGERRLIL